MKSILLFLLSVFYSAVYAGNMPVYIVGSDSNYPPFEFRDGSGQIIGFEHDLLSLIGSLEGFSVQVIYSPRGLWQKKLDNNEVDIFASALGISPKRQAVAEMSDPFLDFEDAIYILDTPANKDLQTSDNFRGKHFVAAKSSKSTLDLIRNMNDGSNTTSVKDSIFLAIREVWAGKADAVVNNNRLFQYYAHKHPQFAYRLIPINTDRVKHYFGFAVKKGRTDLIQKINDGLKKAQANGKFAALFQKWFGVPLTTEK